MALGRGLASLIPRRSYDEDEDLQEDEELQIESALEVEDAPALEVEETEEVEALAVPIAQETDDNEGGFELPSFGGDSDEEVVEEAQEDAQEEVGEVEEAEIQESEEMEMEQAEDMQTEEGVEQVEAEIEEAEQPVAALEDFSQLEGEPEIEMPVKPNVTPLQLDPELDNDLFQVADEAAARIKAEQITPVDDVERIEIPSPTKIAGAAVAATVVAVSSEKSATDEADSSEKWDKHEGNVQQVAIGDITVNPLQPRRHFSQQELEELKASIDKHGILQPLVVQRLEDGSLELIAGERRMRAAKALGWTKVPAVVRKDVRGNESRMVYALIENIQRQDLDPMELAFAYKSLADEFGMSHEEIGERVGKSRVAVTNAMRVLQLPAEIQQGLSEGKITAGHARAILMIPEPAKQIRFYNHLLEEGMTVRKAEVRARRIQRQMDVDHEPMRNKNRKRHPLAIKYAPALEDHWGANVNVKFNEEKNRFEVIFKAYSMQEFETLVGKLLNGASVTDTSIDDDVLEA